MDGPTVPIKQLILHKNLYDCIELQTNMFLFTYINHQEVKGESKVSHESKCTFVARKELICKVRFGQVQSRGKKKNWPCRVGCKSQNKIS